MYTLHHIHTHENVGPFTVRYVRGFYRTHIVFGSGPNDRLHSNADACEVVLGKEINVFSESIVNHKTVVGI